MENKSYDKFNEIMIVDELPIFFIGDGHQTELQTFEKLGIKTLEDLFIAYEDGVFNDKRKKFYSQIKGQIELLLSYYMDAPLISDSVLETVVNISSTDHINELVENQTIQRNLNRLGISNLEFYRIYLYCLERNFKIITNLDGNIRIVDLLKQFSLDNEYHSGLLSNSGPKDSKVIQNLMFKINFILERTIYNSNGSGSFTMHRLQNEMKYLLKARDNLELQISLLQTQLSNVKNSKGIKK